MRNTFGWMQLGSSNPKKAQDFYGKLFQWNFQESPTSNGPYIQIDAGEGACAGIAQGDTPDESQWVPFVNVSNIKDFTEKAQTLGGKVIVPITEIGGDQGFYTVILDPTGAVIGLYGRE